MPTCEVMYVYIYIHIRYILIMILNGKQIVTIFMEISRGNFVLFQFSVKHSYNS